MLKNLLVLLVLVASMFMLSCSSEPETIFKKVYLVSVIYTNGDVEELVIERNETDDNLSRLFLDGDGVAGCICATNEDSFGYKSVCCGVRRYEIINEYRNLKQ